MNYLFAARRRLDRARLSGPILSLFVLGVAAGAPAQNIATTSVAPGRVEELKSFHGVPVLIVRPKELRADTPLVVLFHGFGPPASPRALARALPLETLPAVLAYVNLPLVAGRLPAGGIDELKRVQEENFVNGLFFPCIDGASGELPGIVDDISAAYHLDIRGGIGLFGFSAGGAAALFSLIESDVPVTAAAVLNAPLSVTDNVRNWEHALGRSFQWDTASRAAADRYDVERQAIRIAERKPVPALLLLRGEADESFAAESKRRVEVGLRAAYRKDNEEARFEVKVLPGLGHNFGPETKATASAPKPEGAEINRVVQEWFERFLMQPRTNGERKSAGSVAE